ncbi:MAG: T9SS type A sorting domain-containing protein [Flavobacteriales bacterium]|nr:T9SS type A sorting domain-containing protein [Flavobacteriales bacterium]
MTHRLPFLFASLIIAGTAAAQGDLCTNSLLVFPGTYTADGPFTGGGATHPDATHADWYSFDPDNAGYITVTSCGDGVRDTRVWVHTGSCGGFLTQLGGDDDGCPTGYPPGNSLLANVPVTPGNLYFIEWDDRWSGQGFTWDLLFHTCPNALPAFTSNDTSITVDWAEGAPGNGFTVEWGPSGFTPGTGTTITGTLGTTPLPVNINGLGPGTLYDVYVTLDCGSGSTSPFTGPWPVGTTGTPILPNEACAGAITLACGDTLFGSTEFALDDTVAACGTGISAPGLWYTVAGLDGAITVSTCPLDDYDTKLNVYAGTCGNLQCVGGNDDACGYQSSVTFASSAGLTYYVLVQGYNGNTGNFAITASCNTCPAPFDVQVIAADDEAEVYWSNASTLATFSLEYGPAGFTPGTGTVITGTLGVDGPPVALTGLTANTDYEVYLTGSCGGGATGDTALATFTTLAQPAATNALCGDAAPITCGDAVNGSTVNGLPAIGPTCAGADITANGVWYTFTGNGDDVALSTCNAANYDSKISVFTGPCGALVCAAGNDDGAGCGTTSSVNLPSVAGTTYRVLVHGYQANVGTFTLTMTCAPACAPVAVNDECAGALTIDPQPLGNCVATTGDNSCSYAPAVANPPCDPFATIQDVWFQFNTGFDADHTITVTPVTATSVSVALYTGCGTPTYVDCGTDLTAPFVFGGLALNTTYYLRVWNAGGPEAGTFTVCDEALIATTVSSTTAAELRVMPVPTSDRLFIEGLAADAAWIEVIDLQGRTVLRERASGSSRTGIDVQQLANGSYLIRTDGATPRTARFVKE